MLQGEEHNVRSMDAAQGFADALRVGDWASRGKSGSPRDRARACRTRR